MCIGKINNVNNYHDLVSVNICINFVQISMSVVELMIVSRIVTTHKDHLSAHVVMDLHLMEMERHVLVSQ